ncbi:hypothetical protein M1771_01930 [Spiroplasma citri]|uniref:Uncharacterized protein n=1 Tax=Spiroplasma citri TaxID=2133 RepID=A0AAX3SZS5_SPICI|nr:hypothetical protein [Spiroplasma citri]WFG96794.1 hypothetical protein M0C40_01940 [Spiroplasma citri]WFH00691.1 hypothetical protein M1771_01930 [Spiroplasma citri]
MIRNFQFPNNLLKIIKKVYKLAETADVIIEIVDARIAHSGGNLLNYAKLNDVKRIILFSNTQKADIEQTKKMNWILSKPRNLLPNAIVSWWAN